jgi:hypothetical protein
VTNGQNENTVPVNYLNVGAPGSEDIALQGGGLVVEMCTQCFALAPTDMIQEHIDSHRQLGQHMSGQRPDQSLPPEGQPDQGLPPDQGQPPEVSGGAPPTAGTQPALWLSQWPWR